MKSHDLSEAAARSAALPAAGAGWRWLLLSAAIVIADQLSKGLASAALHLHQPLALLPSLNLTLVHNEGAAFSLLGEAGGWQRWLFIALAVVISLWIIVWLRSLPRSRARLACGLSMILGGALGNLWDRIAHGYVVDFIDVYYGQWHFPAFNVADSAITLGAAILALDTLMGDRPG